MKSEKTCIQCQKTKNRSDFFKRQSRCKTCQREEQTVRRLKDLSNPDRLKVCSRCKRPLPARDFTPGYHRCRKCNAEYQTERRRNDEQSDPNTPRKCFKCGCTKPLRDFHPGNWCKECYRQHHQKDHLLRPERYLLRGARCRAKKYQLPIDITIDDIVIPSKCPDLDIPLKPSIKKVKPNSPTLDRIIPELGYVKGNIRVVSSASNRMKQETTLLQSAAIWSNVLRSLPKVYTMDEETREALRMLALVIQQTT